MQYSAIKKELAALEKELAPQPLTVIVEIDGNRVEKLAAEWWEHREEWALADLEKQTGNSLVVCLLLAAMCADALKTERDPDEINRLTEERDSMLDLYYRE